MWLRSFVEESEATEKTPILMSNQKTRVGGGWLVWGRMRDPPY